MGTAVMYQAMVLRGFEGILPGAALGTALQPPLRYPLAAASSRLHSSPRHEDLADFLSRAVSVRPSGDTFTPGLPRRQPKRVHFRAIGDNVTNGYLPTETRNNVLKQSGSGGPQDTNIGAPVGNGEGVQDQGVNGPTADLSADQKAALQALDAQLNQLSDVKPEPKPLNPRRKFAEELARKSGRPIPSESAPSKRTLAGDYLDKHVWNPNMIAEDGLELDMSFLAYTGAALFALTVVLNLFLNKFVPLPTKAEVAELRRQHESFVFPERFKDQDIGSQAAPSLRDQ